MRIAVIGLGIIGGSLCKAFSEYTPHHVMGYNRTVSVAQQALKTGAIDEICTPEALQTADVVYLCLYPQAAVEFVKTHHAFFRPGCIVTDTAGIKTAICCQLKALADQYAFTFVGSHPMAGKERNGFEASEASLFHGASYILTPCGAPRKAVDILKKLALEIGFAATPETTPEEHDRRIAFTSQVPHVLACAYVMSPQCPNHKGYSAGSYRDVSRVARINETLWAELFLENQGPLTAELDTLIHNLTVLRDKIAEGDPEALKALLKQGREIKEALGE